MDVAFHQWVLSLKEMEDPGTENGSVSCIVLGLHFFLVGFLSFSEVILVRLKRWLSSANLFGPLNHFLLDVSLELLLVDAGKIAKSMHELATS